MTQPRPPPLIALLPTCRGYFAYGDSNYSVPLLPRARGPPRVLSKMPIGRPFSDYADRIARFAHSEAINDDFYCRDLERATGRTPFPRDPRWLGHPAPNAYVIGEFLEMRRSGKTFALPVQFYDLPDDQFHLAQQFSPPNDWIFEGFGIEWLL